MTRRRDVLLPARDRAEPQLHPPGVARRDRATDRILPGRDQLAARGADQARHATHVVPDPRFDIHFWSLRQRGFELETQPPVTTPRTLPRAIDQTVCGIVVTP